MIHDAVCNGRHEDDDHCNTLATRICDLPPSESVPEVVTTKEGVTGVAPRWMADALRGAGMIATRIVQVRVTVMMVSEDGRAIDRTIPVDLPPAVPVAAVSFARVAAGEAAKLVLERLAGGDNRRS